MSAQPTTVQTDTDDACHESSGHRRICVLWIDDDAGVIESSRTRLHASGIDVDAVRDGEQGLERLGRGVHDLIILDERLPGMSGLAFLDTLRTRKNLTPVIVLTGWGAIDSAFRAARLGAVDYHEKPLVGRALIDAIHASALRQPGHRQDSIFRQTTWRPAPDELGFLEDVAAREDTSKNVVLRRLVRAAMRQNGTPDAADG